MQPSVVTFVDHTSGLASYVVAAVLCTIQQAFAGRAMASVSLLGHLVRIVPLVSAAS